jgi:uncharacterized HhH-GPD family protein
VNKSNISEREKRIVNKLLAYKRKYEMASSSKYAFTNIKEAEDLVKKDWNAFLFAVIFDQHVPSEKAWAMPLELKKRLGYLDVYKIAGMKKEDLIKIFRNPTPLHRYTNKMVSWIQSACKKLVSEYAGRAENLWSDTKEAGEIIERFDNFEGIGQKKSTMATNFLADYFKIPIVGWENIDISVDIMIRRVFKKLGLVAKTASDYDIILKARTLEPSFPGELDSPCWDIGRSWCLSSKAYCYYKEKNKREENCPLVEDCPSAEK